MNWLIIAPDIRHPGLKEVELLLEDEHGTAPYELFVEGELSKDELSEAVRHVLQATHCIVIDSERLLQSNDFIYLLGVLQGKNTPTFVFTGGEHAKRYEAIHAGGTALKTFSSAGLLADDIRANYSAYEAVDAQRLALIDLFAAGIPFTSDCFAAYIAKDDDEKCEQFYKAGMLVDSRDSLGVPMLCIATRNDCVSKVKWLVEKGADINAVAADRGYTAVMDAVWRKNVEITKFLIEAGADLSTISSDGQSILVLAVGNGNTKIIDLLLANGADPDVKDAMGMSARQYAELFKKEPILEVFRKYGK